MAAIADVAGPSAAVTGTTVVEPDSERLNSKKKTDFNFRGRFPSFNTNIFKPLAGKEDDQGVDPGDQTKLQDIGENTTDTAMPPKSPTIRSKSEAGFVKKHIVRRSTGSPDNPIVSDSNDPQNLQDEQLHNEELQHVHSDTDVTEKPKQQRRYTFFDSNGHHLHNPIDWKDLRHTLKLSVFPKRKEEEDKDNDSMKPDTELISELIAGAPAALVIGSMFQRDDKNAQRIPLLLEQLRFKLIDISHSSSDKNRLYNVELEYGQVKWSVRKEFKDFWTFHSKFKVLNLSNGGKLQLPKFPARHSIFTKIERRHRDLEKKRGSVSQHPDTGHPSGISNGQLHTSKSNQSSVSAANRLQSIHSPESTHSTQSVPVNVFSNGTFPQQLPASSSSARHVSTSNDYSQPKQHSPHQPQSPNSFQTDLAREPLTPVQSGSILSVSSNSLSELSGRTSNYFRNKGAKFTRTVGTLWDNYNVSEALTQEYNEALCVAVERYMRELLKLLRFKADANRLFQFLEVSNMTIRLAPESSFHGKEGYLILRSSAAVQGWRVSHWRPNDITQMVVRHTSKWYMVRESYIVCVKDISETTILEVFLVDSGFKVTHSDGVGEEGGHITFQVENLERKMKLLTNSKRQMGLWMDSINLMKENTLWSKPNRFNSFAPVRTNVQAQWFVDAVSI